MSKAPAALGPGTRARGHAAVVPRWAAVAKLVWDSFGQTTTDTTTEFERMLLVGTHGKSWPARRPGVPVCAQLHTHAENERT
jgi:hypothetical protein